MSLMNWRYLFVLFFALSCTQKVVEPNISSAHDVENVVKPTIVRPNIILMIGDGMGVTQLSSRWYYGDGRPQYVRFPYVALLRTSSGRERITDSAAGATAYSTGKKSYNGSIAVDLDTVPAKTLLETLEEDGYNSALIATSSIVHATPASFYAHVDSRNKYEEIATHMVGSGVDYFAGGGIKFFAHRTDERNLINELEEDGYIIDTSTLRTELDPIHKYGFLLAQDGMPKYLEGRDDFLNRATLDAISYLERKGDPFFMMVEGSQIDWGGHANDAEYLQSEMLDFDHVIGSVLDYAEKDGNTLVIVTADHECGGFALSSLEVFKKGDYNHIDPKFTTMGHSAAMVPLLAYGPGAENFSGVYENTEVYHRLMNLLGK